MKNVYAFLGLAAAAAAFLCSCNKEIEPKKYDGPTTTVTVRAVLPEEDASKVVYMENDEILLNAGIDSRWENGDCFYAIVSNQNADTGETEESVVKFNLTEGAGTPVGTFQAEVPSMDANTTWTAVFGHFSSEVGEAKTLKCTYDGQDGTLSNLQAYDFMVAYATGEHPEFNFTGRTAHGEGRDTDRLTYFLRIKLPEGIRYIEYCTATDWSVSAFNGNVPSNEEHFACVKDLHPGNWDGVSMIDLGSESASGDVCYLAIPACQNGYYNTVNWNATQGYWSENPKGLIITFFSGNMRKSNGKVINSNLKAKGGFVGTSDLTGMELIDRPLAEEAVFLGSSTVTMKKANYNTYNNFDDYVHEMAVCPEWAPFNLGAKADPTTADEVYGDFFCWGETAPRTEFSQSAYTYNGNKTVGNLDNFSANMLGVLVNYSVYDGENTDYCTLQRISGTKYDAARVRWGSEWRMPIEEEFYSFTGGCRLTAYNNSVCQNKAVDSYNGVSVNGRQMGPDGNSVFFPFCGCYGTSRDYAGSYGYYWSDTRLRGTPSNRNLTNNPLRARFGSGMEYASNNLYDGLAIRPVRNYPIEKASSSTPTVAEEGFYNAYGYVKNNSGTGIAGVAVSDGYTTVLTDSNGKYEMVANPNARYVYVSVPAEYEIPMTTVSLQNHDVCTPAFYKLVTVQEGIYSSDNAQNFGTFTLTPRASVKDRVTLIAVTDAHVRNISGGQDVQSAHNDDKFLNALLDVQETAQTLESGIPVGTPANADAGEIIGITLGDQNWDGLETYSDIIKAGFGSIKSTGGNPVPFFFTIGNHDYQSGDDSDDYHAEQHFIEHFGPTNYSFNVGNVHFIVMDNIVKTGEAGDKIKHTQKFTEEQITWIKSDVAKVSNVAGKICVLCLHAPLTQSSWDSSSDRQQAVMSTIKKFKAAHVFSGHTHSIKNNLYRGWACKNGRSIYEHTLQALCGAWWDADVTRDGSPAGYGVFTFDQNDIYAEYNKVTKEDPDFQIRSYDGSATYNRVSLIDDIMHGGARGYKAFNWDSPVRGKFLCRVWDASPVNDTEDTWSISLTYNGSNKGAMTAAYDESEQLNAIDACVASFLFNDVAGPYGDYCNMETHPQMFYSAQSYGSSSFTITAKHTMRSGWSATYTSSRIVNNYKGFRSGENYDR